MTNKEAYEILEKYISCSNNECPPVDCDECQDHVTAKQLDDALQVALEALQEPKQPDSGTTSCINPEIMHDRTTDGLISRDEAIDDLHGKDPSRIWDTADIEVWVNGLPSVQPESCGDAVSRNAIIRALNTMDRYVSDELTLCDTDRKFPKNEVFIVDDVYEEIVENLPSVQSEPSIRIITAHLKQRLWETALNNVAIKGTLGDAYADVARHRLDAWMDEITDTEDNT